MCRSKMSEKVFREKEKRKGKRSVKLSHVKERKGMNVPDVEFGGCVDIPVE